VKPHLIFKTVKISARYCAADFNAVMLVLPADHDFSNTQPHPITRPNPASLNALPAFATIVCYTKLLL
jgi:hypothetical protein